MAVGVFVCMASMIRAELRGDRQITARYAATVSFLSAASLVHKTYSNGLSFLALGLAVVGTPSLVGLFRDIGNGVGSTDCRSFEPTRFIVKVADGDEQGRIECVKCF